MSCRRSHDVEAHHLGAGSTMYLPAGLAHRFAVDESARTLPDPDPEEFARWVHHAPTFGLEVLGPGLDPLAA